MATPHRGRHFWFKAEDISSSARVKTKACFLFRYPMYPLELNRLSKKAL